jgi:hypothetical protein
MCLWSHQGDAHSKGTCVSRPKHQENGGVGSHQEEKAEEKEEVGGAKEVMEEAAEEEEEREEHLQISNRPTLSTHNNLVRDEMRR